MTNAADEMIGTDVPPVSAEQRMAHGVRVAFDTRHYQVVKLHRIAAMALLRPDARHDEVC